MLKTIKDAVEEVTGLQINKNTRQREYVMARMYYAYFARHYTLRSLTKVGKEVNRDHATVLHYVKTIKNLIETDKETRQVVDSINKYLRTI